MDDQSTLTFYKLCRDCNLNGLIDTFGNLSDTTNIEMDYAYYIVYQHVLLQSNRNQSPILEWLIDLDPNIDFDRIANDYMADEHIPNDALHLACVAGHFEVIKWLLEQEPYLSSFKNRCHICYVFRITCCNSNLDITKLIFGLLADYISERVMILNQAYLNAASNQNTKTMKWLLEIDPNINTRYGSN
jgi:ankyrin repeat protein